MRWSRWDPKSVCKVVGSILVLGLVGAFVVFAVPQVAGANHSYVVLSSSMAPALQAGDAILVDDVSPQRIERGDVVTFEPPAGHGEYGSDLVTHRVVEVVERDDGRYFRTKGDANAEPDRALVPAENVVGRVSFALPYLGHVVSFANSDAGILSLVVVPAVLLGLNEGYELWVASRRDAIEEGTPRESDSRAEE
jgi:signal peptidase